jgi:2,3-bisphosphoglycerate-dependent phosphoglycerate mutase
MGHQDSHKMGRLIIIRHGESEFNQEDRFSGWIDTPLTEKGRQQAMDAGKIIRDSQFVPDAVYTTRLSRARDTTKAILNALGNPKKPMIERDELLERHYGALTGLKKEETRKTLKDEPYITDPYGVAPPPITPDNPHHPDNPSKGLKVIGFPKNGKGSESIKDVVDRVRPVWMNDILPHLQRGENVLISAHANTLRALNMIVENLPPEKLKATKIPNATPVEISIKSAPGSKEWTFEGRKILDGKGNGQVR